MINLSHDNGKGSHVISKDGRREYMQASENERLLAMFVYLTGLVTWIIGPIFIWLLKREDSEYIDYHGKEGLNFIISYTIYFVVLSMLSAIFSVIPIIGWIPLLFIVPIISVIAVIFLVFVILGAVKAYNNELYKIPFIVRIIN